MTDTPALNAALEASYIQIGLKRQVDTAYNFARREVEKIAYSSAVIAGLTILRERKVSAKVGDTTLDVYPNAVTLTWHF